MNQLEHTSQVTELWDRLSDMRGQEIRNRPFESVIAPLAALLLLCWAEHRDTEQEAVAAFDGHDHLPALPRDQHWSSWCELRGERLAGALQREVLPALRRTPSGGLGQSLQRLVAVVEGLTYEPPDVVETLVQWAQIFDLDTASGKQEAGDALAALLDQATEKSAKFGRGLYNAPSCCPDDG